MNVLAILGALAPVLFMIGMIVGQSLRFNRDNPEKRTGAVAQRIPLPGERWALRENESGDPWPTKAVTVLVCEVRANWVRYSHSDKLELDTPWGDCRRPLDRFLGIYEPAAAPSTARLEEGQ